MGYGPTEGPTDGPTDRRTDKHSYRDAIAASKNLIGESLKLIKETQDVVVNIRYIL